MTFPALLALTGDDAGIIKLILICQKLEEMIPVPVAAGKNIRSAIWSRIPICGYPLIPIPMKMRLRYNEKAGKA